MNNLFIVFEGIDGAGTTTQAERLRDYFESNDQSTYLTAEPTTGPLGQLLRKLLSGKLPDSQFVFDETTNALLFAADRAQHCKQEIEPQLLEGHVISDRYYYSSIAYQGETPEQMEWIYQLNARALRPDLVFHLVCEPKTAWQRIAGRTSLREIYERYEFLHKLVDRYEMTFDLAKAQASQNRVNDNKDARPEKIITIDANPDADQVFEAVIAALNDHKEESAKGT